MNVCIFWSGKLNSTKASLAPAYSSTIFKNIHPPFILPPLYRDVLRGSAEACPLYTTQLFKVSYFIIRKLFFVLFEAPTSMMFL